MTTSVKRTAVEGLYTGWPTRWLTCTRKLTSVHKPMYEQKRPNLNGVLSPKIAMFSKKNALKVLHQVPSVARLHASGVRLIRLIRLYTLSPSI